MVAAVGHRLVIDSSDDDEGVEFVSELINGLNVHDDDDPSPSTSSSSDAESVDGNDGDENSHGRKKTLMPHQRTGLDWLLNLYKIPSGGILADDMGLGKTFQVASFVHILLERKLAKRILIVAPKTLLGAWENEVSKELEMDLKNYGGGRRATTKIERQAIIEEIARDGGILMMTYGLIQRDADIVRTHKLHDEDDGPFWDVLVMDEGHTLKNTGNKTRAEIEKVDARMKLLITGTPIQNNLMELHSLFDLVKEGLLGDKAEFKDTFEKPIKRGTSKEASRRSQDMGAMASLSLQKTYAPFMLRRTKEEVMGTGGGGGGVGSCASTQASWQKKDIVVWLRLTDTQLALYRAFLRSKSVREVLNRNRSALASLTVLKKICKHPALLTDDFQDNMLDGLGELDELGELRGSNGGRGPDRVTGQEQRCELDELRGSAEWKNTQGNKLGAQSEAMAASCKTLFVIGLLDRLTKTNHRTLVFSESKVMLNILEDAIEARRWKYLRIDGDVDGAERQNRVTKFQQDDSYPVFLLTSQVGGLGLTLTAADRVILCDPSWNPSVDNQSVDRACRLGQTRDVLVYRLVTCGTIEDKVYQKQVFKGAIFKAGTEQGEQMRYFSESETQVVIMQDLFSSAPEEFLHSSTQKQLESRHSHQREIPADMQHEIDSLSGIQSYVGFSDHDLLYSEVSAVSERIADQARVFQSSSTPRNKARVQDRDGDTQLAAMFDKALSLGPPSAAPSISLAEAREEALVQLQIDIRKQEKLLSNASLLASLPDGGAKVRETVAKLRDQLRKMEAADSDNVPARNISDVAGVESSPVSSSIPDTHGKNLTDSADLLASVHLEVSEPTPLIKQRSTAQTTAVQEQSLILRAKMKRAKAKLYNKAKELEAYRLGTHIKLDEDARLKADVERLLDEFLTAKAAWERGS